MNTDQARLMTEKDLLASVRALARDLGWMTFHVHDSRKSEPGWPDLVLLKGDRMLHRELKTMQGRLSPAQVVVVAALEEAGADVAVWRPVDLLDGTVAATLGARRVLDHAERAAGERS